MSVLPRVTELPQYQLMTQTFYGRNHQGKIGDGQSYEETNMSAEEYPNLAVRRKRSVYLADRNPLGLAAKDAPAWVDGSELWYNGLKIPGITLSTDGDMLPKQLVSMGAYLIVWPDGVYVNTHDFSDSGKMAVEYRQEGASVSLTPCSIDGENYELADAVISDNAPEEPVNGDYWIDTSGGEHILRQYSAASGAWASIATVYVKIGCPGIGEAFNQYDGIEISGLAYSGDNPTTAEQVESLNAANHVQLVGADWIVVTGMLFEAVTVTCDIEVTRPVPKMQYITELNNRLWGCFYGMSDGKVLNEIYCSALGDMRVWRRFLGTGTDSYAVSVGSDGAFTGIIAHMGEVLAWKENCVHRIYGTEPAGFTLDTTLCEGVQKGSWQSLVSVNGTLYYKSRGGVMAYDGSLPAEVGKALGDVRYYEASAGAFGALYYISMRDKAGEWHLMTFDTEKGIWHREDGLRAAYITRMDDSLLAVDPEGKRILDLRGEIGTPEEGLTPWSWETGVVGYEYAEHKYLSRFNIRLSVPPGATARLAIEYDSSGVWVEHGGIVGKNGLLNTMMLPVIPRRCDHLRLRIYGTGDVRIWSIARILEVGGDG